MKSSPIVLLHSDRADNAAAILREYHPDLTIHTCDSYEGLAHKLEQSQANVVYSVRFAGTPNYPREALLESHTVKWLSVGGSGTDHLQAWDPNEITITNAAGVAADMMAEYALGTLLSFRLNLRSFQQAQQQKQWIAGSVTPVQGSTVLIIGLGKTGCAVAKKFNAMGISVLGVRANPKPTEFVDEVHRMDHIEALLPRADAVVVAVPLLPSTQNLLSGKLFKQMRKNCILIDVSRGGVVNEAALVSALDAGEIAGAALDVMTTEPLPADNTLWDRENVIITPHCSSVYEGWEARSVAMFAENLTRYRSAKPLHNIVDPIRGY